MKTHLLNALAQTSRENRLLFEKPPEAQPPAQAEGAKAEGKAADKPDPAKAEQPTEADFKAKSQEKITALKTIVGPVGENKDGKYTKGLAETAKKTIAAITEIEEILKDEKALEKKANKEKAKKVLLKLDEDLKVFSKEQLEANEKVQKDLIAVRKKLEDKKKEITEDAVLKKLGVKPEELEAKRKELGLKAKFDDVFKKGEDALKDDPNISAKDLQKKIDESNQDLDKVTLDLAVEAIKLGEKLKKLNEKVYNILKNGNDGKELDFKLEEFQSAMGTYKLGEHENPAEKAKAKSIMDALKKNQEALKKEGIILGFFGGTDGNDFKTKLDSNTEFNKNKKEAFQGILEFKKAGKIALTPEHEELINKYLAATDIKAFFSDAAIKSKFFDGHGLFDLALSYQRAQDRKRLFTGKKDAVLDPKEDVISFELGSSKAQDNDERKSGMFVVEVEKNYKYTTPEFRAEIKKVSPNATDDEIEAKTVEVFNEKKHGDKIEDARKNPEFIKAVNERLNKAPAQKPPEESNEEKAERAECLKNGTHYKTKKEALDAGDIEETDYPGKPGEKLLVIKDKNKEFVTKGPTTNFALKDKAPELAAKKTFDEAKASGDIEESKTEAGKWQPKAGHIWVDSPVGKATAAEQNWAVKRAPAPAPGTIEQSKTDHAYTLPNKDGQFNVTLLGETTPKDYEFMWDNGNPTFGLSKDPNDNYVTITIDGRTSLVEFDRGTKELKATDADTNNKFSEKFSMARPDASRKINITSVVPPVEPPAPIKPPDAPNAAAEKAAAAEALNTTLGTAKAKVEEKIKIIEDTIDKAEGAFTKGTAQEKIAASKQDLHETFTKVKGLLGEAEKLAKEGKMPEAKAKYAEAQKILDEKLRAAQEQDSKESYLEKVTQDKIKDLRDEVATQKTKVDAAFDKVTK
jgi:hypothetical protein